MVGAPPHYTAEKNNMRRIKDSDIVGKTIQSVENTCVNTMTLVFTDGSKLELEAEQTVRVGDSYIPGIFVSESSNEG